MGNTPLCDVDRGGDGLYPNRSNQMPDDYREWGIEVANSITKVDANGNPDPKGRIVLGSINGMSNFNNETKSLYDLIWTKYQRSAPFVRFNGNRGSWDLSRIVNDPDGYWHDPRGGAYTRYIKRGLHPEQMQVTLMKNSIRGLDLDKQGCTNAIESQWNRAIDTTLELFPNIKIILMSSAMWTGFNTKQLPRKEPQAYYEGYGVKQLIERRIESFRAGDRSYPFIGWLTYMWADGDNARSFDGLKWLSSDFAVDKVHPGPGALQKWSTRMLNALESLPVTKPWFLP